MTTNRARQRPTRAPAVSLWHEEWRFGWRVNSITGDLMALEHHKNWVDNDFGLSADGVWCNGHQNPDWTWFGHGRSFRDFTWAELAVRVRHGRHLRDDLQAFQDAHHYGRKVEVEVKHIARVTDAELLTAFQLMAAHARAVFGPGWRDHVRVKILTSLVGGEAYALRICKAAHAAGFVTIVLARGMSRFHRFEGHPEVTYVRGSAVIR